MVKERQVYLSTLSTQTVVMHRDWSSWFLSLMINETEQCHSGNDGFQTRTKSPLHLRKQPYEPGFVYFISFSPTRQFQGTLKGNQRLESSFSPSRLQNKQVVEFVFEANFIEVESFHLAVILFILQGKGNLETLETLPLNW